MSEFMPLLDEILAFPMVESVRWTQHTPYFNDGDVCEFGTGEVLVRFNGWDDDEEEYVEGAVPECIRHSWEDYGEGYMAYYYFDDEFPELAQAVKQLEWNEIDAFEHALEEAFGDPAEVTATREGFHVEHYEGE